MTKQPFRFMFFLLISLSISLTATAQVVNIPAPNLRAAVETALGKGPGDTITAADMAKLTRLEAKNANISDLTGLEHGINLRYLNLSRELVGGNWINSNSVSDLSPLSGLTRLTDLWLESNAITDISPLSGLVNLVVLQLGDNNVSDISPLVDNMGLGSGDTVNVQGNPLSSVSIKMHVPALQGRGVTVEFDDVVGDDVVGESIPDPNLKATLEGPQIYWIGKSAAKGNVSVPVKGVGKIQRANLDGTGVQDLVTDLAAPWHIALDIPGGKMYWTDSREIKCANLDGTGVQDFVTGLESPQGIALDVAGGKMYWTDSSKIQCANLDGTDVEDLVTSVQVPTNVALDVAGGKMYWADWSTEKIQCANLDGTNVQDLVITGVESVWHIALDVAGGKMYWTNWSTDSSKIQCANLDGTGVQDLVTGLRGPHGIALDVAGGKMYWTGSSKIQCANLDGTNVQDVVTGVNPLPLGIALAIPPDPPPARVDVNQDGKVNITDLLLVVSTLGNTAPALLFGDVNEDNRVTIDDVLLVIEALDDPVTAAAPSNNGRILPLEGATFEAHLNRLRSHSDGSLKYQRAIAFFQNLLASVAPPDKTELLANYPNPFNPETWIPYRLAEDGFVALTIYDLSGRVVRTLAVGHRIAAAYESRSKAIHWDGRNNLGEQVASGVYFYHLSAGDYSQTRKMLILK